MFSLQRNLGRDADFCRLLVTTVAESVKSVKALKELLANQSSVPNLEVMAEARRKDKEIVAEISELLSRALVTSFEREDIESLSESLYKIPKTLEKFAERYVIHRAHIRDYDFTPQLVLIEQAVSTIQQMLQAFADAASVKEIKRFDSTVQRIENEADHVILELLQKLYHPDFPPIKALILKDLIELNEKVVDRCRNASQLITRIVIKNS
jgi:uncharacterized protein